MSACLSTKLIPCRLFRRCRPWARIEVHGLPRITPRESSTTMRSHLLDGGTCSRSKLQEPVRHPMLARIFLIQACHEHAGGPGHWIMDKVPQSVLHEPSDLCCIDNLPRSGCTSKDAESPLGLIHNGLLEAGHSTSNHDSALASFLGCELVGAHRVVLDVTWRHWLVMLRTWSWCGANFWSVSPIYVFILESYERRQPLWRSVVKELRWHDTTRHDTTRHDTTRHDTTRHDTTRHDTTRHDTTRQDQTRPDQTRPDKTRHDKTRQDKTRQDKTRQDKTRQDKTRQDKTRQDKTRQDKTRQDKTRQDKTRQDKTRQEKRREEKRREEKRREEKRRDKTRQDKTRRDTICRQTAARQTDTDGITQRLH